MSLKIHAIILLGISLVAILAIAIGIVVPSVRRIAALQKQITTTQSQFEKQYREATAVRRSIREAPEIAVSLEPYQQATIRATDALDMISLFESLATTYNIDQTINVRCETEAPKPAKGQKPNPINLPGCIFSFLNHGTVPHQLSYLAALERLPQYLYIDSMSWEKRRSGNTEDVSVEFSAKIYVK